MQKNKKKKLKKTTIVSRVILIIYLILTLITLGIIISMNILPSKYLIPLLIGWGFISALLGLFAWKNNFRNWLKIVSDIIFVIIIGICGFGLYYLNSTFTLLDNIKDKDYQLVNYYVLVLNNSELQKLDDLEDNSLGTYKSADETYEKALKQLEKKVSVETNSYDSYLSEADALMSGEVDSIFISAINKDMLDESVDKFDESVRC